MQQADNETTTPEQMSPVEREHAEPKGARDEDEQTPAAGHAQPAEGGRGQGTPANEARGDEETQRPEAPIDG